jgi:segregation and condensation protein B
MDVRRTLPCSWGTGVADGWPLSPSNVVGRVDPSSEWTWLRAVTAAGFKWHLGCRRRQPTDAFGVGPVPFRRTPALARLEAALLVAEGPLSLRRLAQCALLADVAEVRRSIDQLNVAYDSVRCVFRIERVANGYQLLTRSKFATWLDRLHQRQAHLKLSPPALETLCIIAFRQPVTRADVEAIRGVQSSEMIKQLMERSLVRITGEENTLGRPYLYGTTKKFLEVFGLTRLDELPMVDLLRPQIPNVTGVETDEADEEGDRSDQLRDGQSHAA